MAESLVSIVVALAVFAGQGSLRPPCDYDCAAALVERQAFEEAIAALQPLAASRPADLRTLNLLGIALTAAGRPDEASAAFRRALARDPAFTPARKNLGVNEFQRGNIEQAERHFRRVLAATPGDPIVHAFLAEIAVSRRNCVVALDHYGKAGDSVRVRPEWLVHNAACLLERGDRAAALALLDALPQADAAARFEAGVALGRAGAYDDAARFFAAAREAGHDAYASSYNEILMRIESGRPAAAAAVGAALLARGPQPAELHNLLARAYAADGRVQDAYDALRTAARLEPANETHYMDLALLCLDHENLDLGLEIVDIGLRHLPSSSALRLQRGVVLVMKGRPDDAVVEFEKAQALDKTAPGPPIALAMAWMQSGRTAQAIEILRGRARADAGNAAIHHMLGVALMRSGVEPEGPEADEALAAFEKAASLDPRLAGAHAELGKLLLKRDEIERGIAALERAMALDPESVSAAYSLAQGYRRAGDAEKARTLLARVSALNARERGDDPDGELRRMVVRIIREGARSRGGTP